MIGEREPIRQPPEYEALKDRIEARFRARRNVKVNLLPLRALTGQVAPAFFAELRAIAETQAREGRPTGMGGGPIWTLDDWRRFVAAARAEGQLPDGWGFGTALVATVLRIEQLLEDGWDAETIHRERYWDRVNMDREEQERAARERDEAARARAKDRETAVREEYERQMIREEARARAKRDADRMTGEPGPRRRRGAPTDEENR